jgi:hypothetical protein
MRDYVWNRCPNCGVDAPAADYRSWADELGDYHYDGKCHNCGEILFTGFVRKGMK